MHRGLCLTILSSVVLYSPDACLGVWECDRHHTEDVFQMESLSHQNQGPKGFHPCASPSPAAQAEDARVLSDNLVSQQRNRFK